MADDPCSLDRHDLSPDLRVGRHRAHVRCDPIRADFLCDRRAVEEHARGAIVDGMGSDDLKHSPLIGDIDASIERGQCCCSVGRPRVEIGKVEGIGDGTGYGAFPDTAWPVDRYDHSDSIVV